MSSAPNVVWLGFIASLTAGLGTGIGGAGVFFVRRLSERLEDGLLSLAAGIMLAAAFFSLLLPALEFAELLADSRSHAVIIVIVGLIAGALALHVIHNRVPHEHSAQRANLRSLCSEFGPSHSSSIVSGFIFVERSRCAASKGVLPLRVGTSVLLGPDTITPEFAKIRSAASERRIARTSK